MDFVWIPIRKHIVCTDFCKAVPKGRYDREKQGSQSGSRKCLYVWRLLVRCIDADLRYFEGIFPGISVYAVCDGYEFDRVCYGSTRFGSCIPALFKGKGGKGIAVSFGCLLGLFPLLQPVAILAVCFIFFSCVLRINPHYYRTLAAYLCALIGMLLWVKWTMIRLGFAIITAVVSSRMLLSEEEKEKLRIKLL